MIPTNTQTIIKEDDFLCSLIKQKFVPCIKDRITNTEIEKMDKEVLELLHLIIQDVNKNRTEDRLTLYSKLHDHTTWQSLCEQDSNFNSANKVLDIALLYLKTMPTVKIEEPTKIEKQKNGLIPKLALKDNSKNHEQPPKSGKSGKEISLNTILNRFSMIFTKGDNAILSPRKEIVGESQAVKHLFSEIRHCIHNFLPDPDKVIMAITNFCDNQDTLPNEEKIEQTLKSLTEKERAEVYVALERTIRKILETGKKEKNEIEETITYKLLIGGEDVNVDEDTQTFMLLMANKIADMFKKNIDTHELEFSKILGIECASIFNDIQACEAFITFLNDKIREIDIIEGIKALLEYKKTLRQLDKNRIVFQDFVDDPTYFNLDSSKEKETDKTVFIGHFANVEGNIRAQLSRIYLKGQDTGTNLFCKSINYLHMLIEKKLPLPLEHLSFTKKQAI